MPDPSSSPQQPSAPINLHRSGPPETILPAEPQELRSQLEAALAAPAQERRGLVSTIVATAPEFLEGWARLGDLARDDVEAYAAYRVGYHRGLDRLRQSGWRGSGFVRWEHDTNRGFLRALDGLRRSAEVIGETPERDRCSTFLHQLDPNWDPNQVDRPPRD